MKNWLISLTNRVLKYLITDPKYYGSTPQLLQEKLQLHVKDVDFLCFRDKESCNVEPLIKVAVDFAKAIKLHVIINSHIDLAYQYGAYGVHLTSMQLDAIAQAKSWGLFVVVSTHTLSEALQAERLGADMITYSPIFLSPNKGEPKGVEALVKVVKAVRIPVIALGGIVTQTHIDKIRYSGAQGFASIRYWL